MGSEFYGQESQHAKGRVPNPRYYHATEFGSLDPKGKNVDFLLREARSEDTLGFRF